MKRHAPAIFYMLLALFLHFSNLSTLSYFSRVHELFRFMVQPLFELKGVVQETTKQALNTYVFLKGVSEENQRLRRELEGCALYRSQLQRCEENLLQISRLLDLNQQVEHYSVTYASVIAYDPSGKDNFIIIDKGQGDGLQEGMLVFYGDSLLGMVEKVYGGSSRVRTVFSQEFSISALSGDKAYIYKGGYPYGSLLHVNLEDTLKEGDIVYLRVPGKSFPKLTIGSVKSVSQESSGFFKSVQVSPAVDVRRVSFCIVIKEKL